MAFAAELAKGTAKIEDCPPILEEKFKNNVESLKKYLAPVLNKGESHIEIDKDKCDGCGICVISCPVNPRYAEEILSGKSPKYPPDEHIIFQIYNGKAYLLSFKNCRRIEGDDVGKSCKICENYCPQKAIKIY